MIRGIVLAAGRSRRMGQPKALLPAAGSTFLGHAVDALRAGGCGEVTVVARPPGDEESRRIIAAARRCGAQIEEVDTDEQIDSLRAALRTLEAAAEAVVVMPVDLPLVSSTVVSALIAAFRRSHAPIVVPVYRSKHGHPVLFAREAFPDLFADALPEGARTVVHAHANRLAEVEVDEAGVLLDVNTPADFRRVAARRGAGPQMER
jgi:molybdenum cofactor cytidylyltransferase